MIDRFQLLRLELCFKDAIAAFDLSADIFEINTVFYQQGC